MPWTEPVLNEFDLAFRGISKYRRFFATGPVQSGKTVLWFIFPTLYTLFELEWDVIIGVPVITMAQGIYNQRILPSIKMGNYAHLIPDKGPGSRGGKITEYVEFKNGATLRFMSASGGDDRRSSFPAPVIIMTEIDKMDTSRESSRETDPASQIEARAKAAGSRALIFGECTTSNTTGRINYEVYKRGSPHKVYMPCKYCKEYILPERKYFGGWQDTKNVVEARNSSYYRCQLCGGQWTEDDKLFALEGSQVRALEPEKLSDTFGFSWNAMASPMQRLADIGEEMFIAEEKGTVDADRKVKQFIWTEPHDDDAEVLDEISVKLVSEKISPYFKGQQPEKADPRDKINIGMGIDIGGRRCHWVVIAEYQEAYYVLDYDYLTVEGHDVREYAITTAVNAFLVEYKKVIIPDRVMVDYSWHPQVSLSINGAFPVKGSDELKSGEKYQITLLEDGRQLVVSNNDYFKKKIHQGFKARLDNKGSIALFADIPKKHKVYARHICSEKKVEELTKAGKMRKKWVQADRQNHWFDSTVYALLALDTLEKQAYKSSIITPDGYEERKKPESWTIGRAS